MKASEAPSINDVWQDIVLGHYGDHTAVDLRAAVMPVTDDRWTSATKAIAAPRLPAGKWAPPRFEFRGRVSKRIILSPKAETPDRKRGANQRPDPRLIRREVIVTFHYVTPQVMEVILE